MLFCFALKDNDRLSVARHAAETDAKMLREELAHRKKVQDAVSAVVIVTMI